MSFSWAFQWYHFHSDPIWPDGTFNKLALPVIYPFTCSSQPPIKKDGIFVILDVLDGDILPLNVPVPVVKDLTFVSWL